jgi:hypothetical protein
MPKNNTLAPKKNMYYHTKTGSRRNILKQKQSLDERAGET